MRVAFANNFFLGFMSLCTWPIAIPTRWRRWKRRRDDQYDTTFGGGTTDAPTGTSPMRCVTPTAMALTGRGGEVGASQFGGSRVTFESLSKSFYFCNKCAHWFLRFLLPDVVFLTLILLITYFIKHSHTGLNHQGQKKQYCNINRYLLCIVLLFRFLNLKKKYKNLTNTIGFLIFFSVFLFCMYVWQQTLMFACVRSFENFLIMQIPSSGVSHESPPENRHRQPVVADAR